jgi:hypothetical protein
MATAGNIQVSFSPGYHEKTFLRWVVIHLKSTSFHPEDGSNKLSENVYVYISD